MISFFFPLVMQIYCTELAYFALRSIDSNLPFDLGLFPTVGGLLQSTTFRANSFIKSLGIGKIVPILEWSYENVSTTDVDVRSLINDTIDPLETSEKSRFLFELTKLAYPFNKDRVLLVQKKQAIKKSCIPNRKLRMNRDDYNIQPKGDLVEIMGDFPFRVFRDEVTLEVYVRVKQSSNLLHCPCIWTKLVSFDCVHGIP